ncbi:TPM domain-containing protein, partial [Pseudobutyrivibrio sp.]
TDESNYGQDEDSILFDFYTDNYNSREDGVAFLIDMYHRELYLSGYGKAQYEIKNADAYDITDNVYRYASKGDYYNCILHVFEQADTLVHQGAILRPMRFAVTFLVSIILGFLLAFFVATKDRKALIKNTGQMEMLLAGASFVGGATIYDSKRVLRHESNSSGGFSSGGGSSSGGGGGFSSGGGGGGHSGGGHSF